MVMTTAIDDKTAARRAWRVAVLDALAIALSSPVLVTAVSAPAIAVILASVPQVAVFVPEPIREVSLVIDGLQGISGDLTQGADGTDGQEVEEEAPEAPTPTPSTAPPADKGDEATGDAVADANPGDKPPAPPPQPSAVINPDKPAPPEPDPNASPSNEEADATHGNAEGAGQGAGTTPEATAGTEAKPARKPGRSGKCAEPNPAIHKLADAQWSVQRSLIDYYTESMDRFNSLGYSHKWEGENGEKGWQIGGFGCSSPLWKAGLRSQDVIQEVNGKKTNNVLQLIGIWISQRKKEDFVVHLLRKGEPIVLSYKVL
jgi:hypothetical protein